MGEMLDIVDMYGDPIGLRLDKQVVHDRGLLHGDVHIWLTDGTHLLQQQRHSDKDIMPDMWDASASGHPQAGESFLNAAMREFKEGLGLKYAKERFVRLGSLPTSMQFANWQQPHRVINDNYVIFEPNINLEAVRFQPGEVQAVRLYEIDRLERDILSPTPSHDHAPHPLAQYSLAIAGMRAIAAAA
jgi:isopentenyl-diphosphate Delta-isomerase